ncbi:TetR family transcriptional regulator [Kineococcus sp. NPDC059986]|uniref:TetR/AcrR family transcriptional regulator n=1 Tax=Kineococcus sp. NPDC059986 TaxID=3155538 RepID=UPI00344C4D13
MGLRELKAERTRASLHTAVLELAEERGYEAVTVEQVADRAEVGVSTLYRYFPNKDAILLDPVERDVGVLAAAFRARPAAETEDVALGHALTHFLTAASADPVRLGRLRAQLDHAPGPRARLWDLWNQQRALLEEAIAERAGTSPTDLRVALAAHLTTTVAQLVLDRQRDAVDEPALGDVLDEVARVLEATATLVPRLPPRQDT